MPSHVLPSQPSRRSLLGLLALAPLGAAGLAACAQGEDASGAAPAATGGASSAGQAARTLTLDFATYNPLSLVIRDQKWLETELGGQGVTVEWVQSAGSNKANEFLRNGNIQIGSTAGAAALLARSNGSPIKVVDVFSQPNWSGVVVGKDSPLTDVAALRGKRVAATTGTDPYFFLVQALETAGLTTSDVTLENLQHADGRSALDAGNVDAWAGLDPIMAAAQAESGAKIIYQNIDFNSYGVLNAREDFLAEHPDLAQAVVNAYEKARAWVPANLDAATALLAEVAGIDPQVATTTLGRTKLDISPVPGATQQAVLEKIGPLFVANGDVPDQATVDKALGSLFEPTYAQKADPS
ncbi:sulfonate transport system substrate-binding protein [Quadrisphaera granulorum]|uniref:Putative aliphatic sulfonates-binding protein n=1 Tax=Quadrisphaera granulorum TaxID=317664 RepID=A0A316A936_9ACTN|nr:aliphatic sulfonate ABC transporter substrate-binding protein [Quadrisphaera granulorum]PWJ53939.1 sulfonate transport system substrate-binding protein [Quadrisphaera granulorum]SZE96396.1 sulfonate transport system substrate-binding protein [Quadrisphaera granulorum]